MREITVRVGAGSHPVVVGEGSLGRLGELILCHLGGERVVAVVDRRVSARHGTAFRRALRAGGVRLLGYREIAVGERSKTLAEVRRLYDFLGGCGAERSTPVLAVGGGVTGDLVGFAAATYLRGLPLVHVPTTVVAQVDSSIGGKTGVNFAEAKNLVGSFYWPRLVVTDPAFLGTLAERDYRAGLAEAVKVGVTLRPALFETLEHGVPAIRERDPGLLAEVVARCIEAKGELVSRDEREEDVRAILNYGHTLGHALEAVSLGRLRHGEAVAAGMNGAAWVGEAMSVTLPGVRERQNELLTRLGLKLTVPGADKRTIARKLKLDKKVRGKKNRFVLTLQMGGASVWPHIPERLLRDAVRLVTS